MSHLSDEQWSQIRAEYEHGLDSTAIICARYKIGSSTLYARGRAEGWRLRSGRKFTPRTRTVRRRMLINRLYSILEEQLAIVMARNKTIGGISKQTGAADDILERNCRAVDALARAFGRLAETEAKMKGPNHANKSAAPSIQDLATHELDPSDHAAIPLLDADAFQSDDALREALAQRFFELQERARDCEAS